MVVTELPEPARRDWGVVSQGETPAARASNPDRPRVTGGRSLGQRYWGLENAGVKAICLLGRTFFILLQSSA